LEEFPSAQMEIKKKEFPNGGKILKKRKKSGKALCLGLIDVSSICFLQNSLIE
jgi:hypothetical protein